MLPLSSLIPMLTETLLETVSIVTVAFLAPEQLRKHKYNSC